MEKPLDDRVVLDSQKLRCLAHPLRSRLLSTLRTIGPSTSSILADRLDTNTGATSYHLRELARVGLVEEELDRGTARERWWRAAHQITSWRETDFDDDPTDKAAADWLLGTYLRLKIGWLEDWHEAKSDWSKQWRAAADSSDLRLQLSPAQLTALNAELHEVISRYRQNGPDNTTLAQPVMVLLDTFPAPELSL
ncbi:MAG: winged helix-turn-helix domain-containing protein [Euzebya sp.]